MRPPASVLKEARAGALRIRKTHRFPRGGNGVPGSASRGNGERGIFVEAPCCRTAHLKNPCAARKDTIFGGEPLYEDPQILYVRIIEKGFPRKKCRALCAPHFFGETPFRWMDDCQFPGVSYMEPPKNGRTYAICRGVV